MHNATIDVRLLASTGAYLLKPNFCQVFTVRNLKSHQPLTLHSFITLVLDECIRVHALAALPLGKSSPYPMNRIRSGCVGEEKSILPLPRIEPRLLG